MRTIHDIAGMRAQVKSQRAKAKSIALVPTMGNLHRGHLALITRAKQLADICVTSIFVNPMQFGPAEDFDQYPRTLQSDQEKLIQSECDLLFHPSAGAIYPNGMSDHTLIQVPELTSPLCGQNRPTHFDGVTTVVGKLLNIVQPDFALFGEKDFQQLTIIRKMVSDLCIDTNIVSVPTQRDSDKLALSSRNQYLSAQQRQTAPLLYQTLYNLGKEIEKNQPSSYQALETQAISVLSAAGFTVDYLLVCQADTLRPATKGDTPLLIAAAAKLGGTRLIDNVTLALRP